MSLSEVFSDIECHADGLDIRIYKNKGDRFKSTIMVLYFDLKCRLEESWICDEDSDYLDKFKDSLIERGRLSPRFLQSFTENWNSYKRGNNEYRGFPINQNIIEFDVSKAIEMYGIKEYNQVPLPEGKFNLLGAIK